MKFFSCTCAGVVNGLDSKSNGFQPREFESRQVRYFFANLRHEGRLSTYMHLHARAFFCSAKTSTCARSKFYFAKKNKISMIKISNLLLAGK